MSPNSESVFLTRMTIMLRSKHILPPSGISKKKFHPGRKGSYLKFLSFRWSNLPAFRNCSGSGRWFKLRFPKGLREMGGEPAGCRHKLYVPNILFYNSRGMKLPHILSGFGPKQVSFASSRAKQIYVYKRDMCNVLISRILRLKYLFAFI